VQGDILNTMSQVVVFGTGTLAQLVDFYFDIDSDHDTVAFTADKEHINGDTAFGKPLIPFDSVTDEYPPDEYDMFVAVGYREMNELREQKFVEAKQKGYNLVSYVNSEITHWGETSIGENCFIFEDQTIQPFVDIGDNVILWSGNHVGHHSTISDHCFVTSHTVISGFVEVGPNSFLGVNSTIVDEVTLAPKTVVGAGATIINDTESGVYIGSAAERKGNVTRDTDL
jgi:sugar O-acyltransferase (sialic acid O-acetyltransferase NeuD family)